MVGPMRNIIYISAAVQETHARKLPDANSKFVSSFNLCCIYIESRVYKNPNTDFFWQSVIN